MEKKNKKMLLIVGVLLLLGGVTFAYFVGSSMFGGVGSSVEGITANINGAELKIEGNLEFNDLDILPGHKNISSIKVTAIGNNELIPYNLIWKGTNSLNTPLEFTVYKTSNEIETSATCEKKSKIENGAQILNEECTIMNEDKLGNIVSSGTINKSEETKEILVSEEFITATSDGMSVYYYIILEYPNLDEDQNNDMGENFNGTVTVEESNAKPDINILAVKVEQEDGTYQDTTDIPQEGYTLNKEKSVCSNGATVEWDYVATRLIASSLSKSGTSCYLYFNKNMPAAKMILKNVTLKTGTPNFNKTTCSDGCDDNNSGVYKTSDEDGASYYFRGSVENNYVKFAKKFWRIIRINGNGSIRMIYDGEIARKNGSTLTTLETSKFNEYSNVNMYVGFKYGTGVHGTETKSTILEALETWYNNYLKDYANKIDVNAGFCGDRSPSTNSNVNDGLGGTGTTPTFYNRFISTSPSLTCSTEDFYTVSGANKGNKSLTNPIGLITADEVVFAGGFESAYNEKYYLYTRQSYWTLTPSGFENQGALVYNVSTNGELYGSWVRGSSVTNSHGVRPVINLHADVKLTGTGTMTDPYIVVGA